MDLSHIRAKALDFDDVWYHETDLPGDEMYNLCDNAAAIAACELLPSLAYDHSLELAKQSYKIYRDGISAHVAYMVEQCGYDQEEARDLMFEHYHRHKFKAMDRDYSYIFDPCEDRIAQLEYLSQHVALGMVTHSSRDEWVSPFLERNGTKAFVRDDHIVDYKDYGYISKAEGADGITLLMQRMGVQPYETIFVDDHLPNLLVAKEEHPELTVALKTQDLSFTHEKVALAVQDVNHLNQLLITSLAKPKSFTPKMK